MCLKEWIFTWISYLNIKLLGRCFIFLNFFFSYIIYKYYDILRTCIILKNLILSVKIFYNTTPTCANKLTAKLKIYFQYHTEKRSYEYFSIYIYIWKISEPGSETIAWPFSKKHTKFKLFISIRTLQSISNIFSPKTPTP